MKKMYEMTVRGYYLVSIVLGVLLAAALQLLYELICVETLYPFGRSVFSWMMFDLELPWMFFGDFASSPEGWWEHILPFRVAAVVLVLVLIAMWVLLMSGKNWRTKALHAIMVAALVRLVTSTINLAYYERTSIETLLMMAMLTVIPLLVLKRTRISKKGEDGQNQKGVEAQRTPSWIGRFVKKYRMPLYVITVVAISVLSVFAPAILRCFFG